MEAERIAEALVFASSQPVSEAFIADRLPRNFNVRAVMLRLKEQYAPRGVNLIQADGCLGLSHRRRSLLRHPPRRQRGQEAVACRP